MDAARRALPKRRHWLGKIYPPMQLESGTRLGNYEVASALGVGRMGEVYRAKDTKLGREVAIKLLLEEVSANTLRLVPACSS